jgi:hypothetical protein
MLVNFTAIWSILLLFGLLYHLLVCVFCGHLVYLSRFGIFDQENLATLAWGERSATEINCRAQETCRILAHKGGD